MTHKASCIVVAWFFPNVRMCPYLPGVGLCGFRKMLFVDARLSWPFMPGAKELLLLLLVPTRLRPVENDKLEDLAEIGKTF